MHNIRPVIDLQFYSHVNYSVTKMWSTATKINDSFYSHVNYSVTKMHFGGGKTLSMFYSHVNYSVTKISSLCIGRLWSFTVT